MAKAEAGKTHSAIEIETWQPTEWEVFHSDDGKAYIDVQERGYRQTYLIRGEEFSELLRHGYYDRHKQVLKPQKLKEIIELLEAKAKFEGPKRDVYLRLAEHEERIYLDLGGCDWNVVEIDPQGWRLVPTPPVRFRRSKGLQPLPIPERGGQFDELQQVLNVDSQNWPLVAAWLVAALNPRGPYPLLVLNGEQGSGKSSLTRMLKALVDPSQGSLRSEPRREQDLMIAADGNWVLCFDNLSNLPIQLSDWLCRLSTGGSFATRRLYSNDQENVLEAARPVILTSIEELVVRGDLLDRCLCVNLPIISEEKRRTEREIFTQYEELKPKLLGVLLDAVSLALRERDKVKLEQVPRMADFAIWVVAAAPALGLEPGAFMKAYNKNREAAHELVLENSPLAQAIIALLEKKDNWEGKTSDLLPVLRNYADWQASKGYIWPKAPNRLSNILRRLIPGLRAKAIEVTFRREGKQGVRIVRLEKVREQPSALSVDTNKITLNNHQGESNTDT